MNLNHAGWPSQLLRLVARLRSDGVNSTTPVTEINGGNISATNADIALVAKGAGATLVQVPDGTPVGGNKRGQFATDLQKSRTTNNQVASGNYATICGGDTNLASANYSFIGGGQNNFTTANTHGAVCGGLFNQASGQYAFVGGGITNSATGLHSSISGGQSNSADGAASAVLGGRYGTARGVAGAFVFGAASPIQAGDGVTQSRALHLARQTTDGTQTILLSDTSGQGTSNQVNLPANSAYAFSGEVIAGVTGAGDTARWTISGAIKRGATAASTALVGTPTVTMTHNDVGASGWTVAVTANTTFGTLAVTVTGAAATTIRWVCRINTTEMSF